MNAVTAAVGPKSKSQPTARTFSPYLRIWAPYDKTIGAVSTKLISNAKSKRFTSALTSTDSGIPQSSPARAYWKAAIKALILGDLLMKCLYRVRPYEVEKGSANKLYELWDTIVRETIEHHGYSKTAAKTPGIRKGYLPYNVLAKEIVKSFDNLPLRDIPRKVRVGVVGEILVKYQPDANNHVVDVIESQDCEAVVPGIMEFMTTRPYITDWNERNLGMGGNKTLYALMRKSLDLYNAPIKAALATSNGKFKQDEPMPELVKKAAEVTSIGVQAGEGWLLTAEHCARRSRRSPAGSFAHWKPTFE